MKILQLISEAPPIRSGFSRVIKNVAEELINLGNEVDVFSAYDCDLKIIGEIKFITGYNEISDHLKNHYDIINIHGHTPMFSDGLLLKSKMNKQKVVYTLHCLADYYLRPAAIIYNTILNNILLKLADAVVLTSKSYYNNIDHQNKYLVPWGVDKNKFSGERIPHDDYTLLFVGQMRPYKGLKILLEAVKDLNLELNIIGDGPNKERYIKYAKKLGLSNTHFYGVVNDKQLKKLYLYSDVLVLPSIRMNEAFGLVTLEAASAGCAVIASDLPGLRDVVKDFGVLVKPNDQQALGNSILTLKDEKIREKHVAKGTKAILKYNWQQIAKSYQSIYEKISSNELEEF